MTEWSIGTGDGPGERTLVSQRQYDWGMTAPVEGIVETVSEATGRPFDTLPPLEHVVKTDAVTALLAAAGRRGPADGVEISFRYEGFLVTAYSTGRVTLYSD